MQLNWIAIIATGIVPLIVGFLWYNPKTFANAWMQEAGLTEDKLKNANMGLIFGLTLLFGIMLATAMMPLTIHQSHFYSILQGNPAMEDPNSALSLETKEFMGKYGQNFRTFKHGSFHGFLSSIFIVLPVLGINALFERRSRKYILLHWGYWAVTFAIMGGLVCAFA